MSKTEEATQCIRCGYQFQENEFLTIRGTANVEGVATVKDFYARGVAWTPHDSWNEKVECPKCGKCTPL